MSPGQKKICIAFSKKKRGGSKEKGNNPITPCISAFEQGPARNLHRLGQYTNPFHKPGGKLLQLGSRRLDGKLCWLAPGGGSGGGMACWQLARKKTQANKLQTSQLAFFFLKIVR